MAPDPRRIGGGVHDPGDGAWTRRYADPQSPGRRARPRGLGGLARPDPAGSRAAATTAGRQSHRRAGSLERNRIGRSADVQELGHVGLAAMRAGLTHFLNPNGIRSGGSICRFESAHSVATRARGASGDT